MAWYCLTIYLLFVRSYLLIFYWYSSLAPSPFNCLLVIEYRQLYWLKTNKQPKLWTVQQKTIFSFVNIFLISKKNLNRLNIANFSPFIAFCGFAIWLFHVLSIALFRSLLKYSLIYIRYSSVVIDRFVALFVQKAIVQIFFTKRKLLFQTLLHAIVVLSNMKFQTSEMILMFRRIFI